MTTTEPITFMPVPTDQRLYVDRSDAPDDQFAPLLARIEAADTVDIGEDARVETVMARMTPVLWDRERATLDIPNETGHLLAWLAASEHDRRCLAVAALAAMHPAHETLRERVEALAEELETRGHRLGARTNHYDAGRGDSSLSAAQRLRAALGGEQ